MKRKVVLIFNHEPYDGTDLTSNGLRLAGTLAQRDNEVRLFLMNDFLRLKHGRFVRR